MREPRDVPVPAGRRSFADAKIARHARKSATPHPLLRAGARRLSAVAFPDRAGQCEGKLIPGQDF